jgi:transposase
MEASHEEGYDNCVDIAKRVFSVYWVDVGSGEISAKMLSRSKFEELMRGREPSCVVLEAGGSAHHWGRWLSQLGHEVRLIAAQHVRPFVRTNKTDGADARAIWEGAQRPESEMGGGEERGEPGGARAAPDARAVVRHAPHAGQSADGAAL